MPSYALSTVPDAPVAPDGNLRIGAYRGALDEVRWGYPTGWLDGQVKRALGRKRWFSAGVFSQDRVIIVRILDQGLVGSGLIWVADLKTGKTELEHRFFGVPLANLAVGPVAGRGAHAFIALPTARLFIRRDPSASAWSIEAQLPGHALSMTLDTRSAPSPLTVIGEFRGHSSVPAPSRGLLISRHVGLEARGTIRFRSEIQSIPNEARGFLEYGNGFFVSPDANEVPAEHEVAWSSALVSEVRTRPLEDTVPVVPFVRPWALASDLATFGDSGESAIWSHGDVRPVGPVTLSGDPSDRRPWSMTSSSGELDLTFQPRCVSIEETRPPALLNRVRPAANAISMRHALIAGHFEGRLQTPDGPVDIMAVGLCEARSFGL